MSHGQSVAKIFRMAGLIPSGPEPWGTLIGATSAGVYALSLTPNPNAEYSKTDLPELPQELRVKWMPNQPVIYIGRTKRSLRHRLRQFYRHKYGNKSPHRGGQAALLVKEPLWVFWAETDQPRWAERVMIDAFHRETRALPFANRCRGTLSETRNPQIPNEMRPPSGDLARDTVRKLPAAR